MSKRYGRNQKRRHRAEAAELQEQVNVLGKELDNQPKEFARLKSLVEEYEYRVAAVLGNRSWLLHCTDVQVERRTQKELDSVLAYTGLQQYTRPPLYGEWRIPISQAIEFVEVVAVRSQLVVDQLTKLVHVNLHFKEGKYSYGISPELIDHLIRTPYGCRKLIEQNAKQIATELVEFMSKNPAALNREFRRPARRAVMELW